MVIKFKPIDISGELYFCSRFLVKFIFCCSFDHQIVTFYTISCKFVNLNDMGCTDKHIRKTANVLVGVAIFLLLGSVILSAAAHLTTGSITDYQGSFHL